MNAHEEPLLIALCQGAALSGKETAAELNALLDEIALIADEQEVRPLQEEMAEWLKMSLRPNSSRQDASLQIRERIQRRDYTLVDVPIIIRRQAFGGSLDIQKRLMPGRWRRQLLRKAGDLLRTLIFFGLVGGAAWAAWIAWKIYQAGTTAEN